MFVILQIYIESKLTEACIRVEAGDRLGVFFEEASGPVAYKFDSSQPMALAHSRRNVTEVLAPGDAVYFDTLTFPYDFSMSAYIDTGKYCFIDNYCLLFLT